MNEKIIEKKNHIISFYKKITMVTKGNLNIGQESLLYLVRIYLEKVKVSVEDFRVYCYILLFKIPVLLKINRILISVFCRRKLYFCNA